MKLFFSSLFQLCIFTCSAMAITPLEVGPLFERTFQRSVSKAYPQMKLVVNLSEKSNYMGGAQPQQNVYEISIGEETLKRLGVDTSVLILCHELGHLLAGAPYKNRTSWIEPFKPSTESRSDYFATQSCFREFFKANSEATISPEIIAPKVLTEMCNRYHLGYDEIKSCERSGIAAQRFLMDVWTFVNIKTFAKPSFYQQARILSQNEAQSQYPSLQCRLDTYLAGNFGLPQPNCN